MARYLSPAKTCLLALVELYVEDAVPHDGALPVLSFITSHLIDVDVDVDVASFSNPRSSRDRWQKARDIVGLIASINDFEQLLSPYSAATGLPGRRLWDVFLHKIWSIDSLHALHQFFDRLRLLLAKTKDELSLLAASGVPPPTEGTRLSRNSPFGTFVRRSQLEFGRLRFSDVGELWKDFVRYRQPTASAWRRRNPAAGPLSFDSVLLAGEHEWGAATADIAAVAYGDVLDENAARRLPASTDDLEILLEFQIDQMQSRCLPCLSLSIKPSDVVLITQYTRIWCPSTGQDAKRIFLAVERELRRSEYIALFEVWASHEKKTGKTQETNCLSRAGV